MITTTSNFDKYKIRRDVAPVRVMRIEGELTTFNLSERAITVSIGGTNYAFHPVVSSWGDINQRFDLFKRSFSIGHTQVILSNVPYRRTSSGMVRLSDDLFGGKLINRPAKIYLGYEGLILEDFILIFDGVVRPPENVDVDEIRVPLYEAGQPFHLTLPKTLTSDSAYPQLPSIGLNKRLPIVYGNIAIPEGTKGPLAEGVWIEPRKAVLADHVLKSVEAVWLLDTVLDMVVKVDSDCYTITLDDGGKTTVTFDEFDVMCHAYIYPNTISKRLGAPNYQGFDYLERSIDEFPDTYMYGQVGNTEYTRYGYSFAPFRQIMADAGAISNVWVETAYKCVDPSLQGPSDFCELAFLTSPGEINMRDAYGTASGGGLTYLEDTSKSWTVDQFTGGQWTIEIIWGTGAGQVRTISNNNSDRIYPTMDWSETPDGTSVYSIYGGWMVAETTSNWNAANLTWETLQIRPTGDPNMLGMHYVGTLQTAQRDFLEVYSQRLHFKYKIQDPANQSIFCSLNAGLRVFSECHGRKFGSWIDAGGRSNSFDEGDMIENPAFVVESILRDELGVPTANIDTTLFDAAATDCGSNVGIMMINDPVNSLQAINDFCFQFKMFLWYSADGRFKIRVHTTSPTVQYTFKPADLKAEWKLKKGTLERLVNKLAFDYMYSRHQDIFHRRLTSVNTTSQTDHRVVGELNRQCPGIVTTTIITSLKDHYTGSSGFWKELWETITIDPLGWDAIPLEHGDIVAFDSSFDNELKLFNASWASKKFMIVDKTIQNDGLSFTLDRIT